MTLKIVATCKDCGSECHFSLDPADMTDFSWVIADGLKNRGFRTSETSVYCGKCVKNHKTGLFGSVRDEMK